MILSAEQLHGLIASIRDRQIAIVEAVGVRAISLQLTPGEQVQAEVIARLPSGQSLANIAGQTFSLPLPAAVKPGETVRLTYLSGEPRLTFALSQSERQGTPTTVSDTARWLGQITRDQSLPASSLPRPAQLLSAPPLDPRHIAAQLRQVVSHSGLFYESHLAEWVAGERPLTGVLQEPQGTLSQPAAFLKAGATGSPAPTTPQPPPALQGRPAGSSPAFAEKPATAPDAELIPDNGQGSSPGKTTIIAAAPLPPPAAGATETGAPLAAKTAGRETTTPMPAPTPPMPTATTSSPPTTPGPATPAALPIAPDAPPPPATSAPPTAPPPPAAGTLSPSAPETTLPPATLPPAGEELPTAATAAQPKPQATLPIDQEPAAAPQQREPAEPRPSLSGPAAVRQNIEPLRADQLGQTSSSASPASDGRNPAVDPAKTGVATAATEPADPRTIPLIRDQLELLQSRTFSWQGEGWPGQPLEWQVEEREANPGDATQRAWTSTLHLDLPHLGEVHAGIQLVGKTLQITINGKSLASVQELRASSQKLREQCEASGLLLTSLEVQHE